MTTTLRPAQAVHARPGEDAATGHFSTYRLDLDGLRGIAIALVAVFHVWFGRVSGGVDVFLTLSGYFFIASLLKHVLATAPGAGSWTTAINPWPRLSRLLRRLLPGLLVVLIAVTALIALIMPATRRAPLAAEIKASALYYQNWLLALESQSYAAADSAISPLQHLWSMSVQGQFFVGTLLFFLILGAVLRLTARRFPVMASPTVVRSVIGGALLLLAAASFAWANLRQGIDQPFNYYDTAARLWEPLVGGLLAVWMPRVAMSRVWRNVAALAALALIITCGWWIVGVASYPGALTLVPVGATLLLIWVGSTATAPADDLTPGGVSRSLGHPWPVWLGSIAYALYLWHWPVLIFYMAHRHVDDVTFGEGALILLVSTILAWATTRFIEAPLRAKGSARTSRRTRRIMVVVLTAATLVAGITVTNWQRGTAGVDTTDLDPRVYPGARAFLDGAPVPNVDAVPRPHAVGKEWPITTTAGMVNSRPDTSVRVGEYGDTTADRTIAVVGGSHSEHWITALDDIGRRQGFRVTTYLKMGCALTVDKVHTRSGEPYPECLEWSANVMEQLLVDEPAVVFTTSTRPRPGGEPGDFMPTEYRKIFSELHAREQRVIAVRDNPWLGAGRQRPADCLSAGGTSHDCGVAREDALSPTDPALAYATAYPNMTFLDYSDAMCDDSHCPAVVGNVMVRHDRDHLSATFIRSLIPAIEDDLRTALRWW